MAGVRDMNLHARAMASIQQMHTFQVKARLAFLKHLRAGLLPNMVARAPRIASFYMVAARVALLLTIHRKLAHILLLMSTVNLLLHVFSRLTIYLTISRWSMLALGSQTRTWTC